VNFVDKALVKDCIEALKKQSYEASPEELNELSSEIDTLSAHLKCLKIRQLQAAHKYGHKKT